MKILFNFDPLKLLVVLLGCFFISNSIAGEQGADSPARRAGNLIFISGQAGGSLKSSKNSYEQVEEAFINLRTVAIAAGGNLDDIVKINVYLTDLTDYSSLNKVMQHYFKKPYPARSTVGVSGLPKGYRVEIDAIMLLKAKDSEAQVSKG